MCSSIRLSSDCCESGYVLFSSLLLPPPSSLPSASVRARVCVLLHDAQSCLKGHSLYIPLAVNADIHAHGAVRVLVCDPIHVANYKNTCTVFSLDFVK